MAEITKDEQDTVSLTNDAIMKSSTPQEAVGHAFNGLAEILIGILYELRVANERSE